MRCGKSCDWASEFGDCDRSGGCGGRGWCRGDDRAAYAGGFKRCVCCPLGKGHRALVATLSADRTGMVVSEGAGIVVLEALEHAQARGAEIHAELRFCHHNRRASCDLTGSRWRGGARCMAQALPAGSHPNRSTMRTPTARERPELTAMRRAPYDPFTTTPRTCWSVRPRGPQAINRGVGWNGGELQPAPFVMVWFHPP